MMRRWIAALCVGASACGVTSSGSGTGTLFADVAIAKKSDSTTVDVDLKLASQPVRGANVVVTNAETGEQTTLEDRQGGRYVTVLGGLVSGLEFRAVSGDDEIEGALEGPEPHEITRPPNDSIVRRSGDSLTVVWESEAPADFTIVTPASGEPMEITGDPGEADVPLAPLSVGPQKIRVTRRTEVELSGGVEGSRIRSTYEVDNRFTLE